MQAYTCPAFPVEPSFDELLAVDEQALSQALDELLKQGDEAPDWRQ